MHTRKIDMTPRAKFHRCNGYGADSSSPFFKDREPDHAVVHQNVVANGDIVYESVVIHIDRIRLLALGVGYGELQNVVLLQLEIGFQVSCADGGALRIEQNSDGSASLFCECANSRHNFAPGAVIGMAHVQSKNIRSFLD